MICAHLGQGPVTPASADGTVRETWQKGQHQLRVGGETESIRLYNYHNYRFRRAQRKAFHEAERDLPSPVERSENTLRLHG
jgi:hypothetical protein